MIRTVTMATEPDLSNVSSWIQALSDEAHDENMSGNHRDGFCLACAEVYVVLNRLAIHYRQFTRGHVRQEDTASGAVAPIKSGRGY